MPSSLSLSSLMSAGTFSSGVNFSVLSSTAGSSRWLPCRNSARPAATRVAAPNRLTVDLRMAHLLRRECLLRRRSAPRLHRNETAIAVPARPAQIVGGCPGAAKCYRTQRSGHLSPLVGRGRGVGESVHISPPPEKATRPAGLLRAPNRRLLPPRWHLPAPRCRSASSPRWRSGT